jgi:hypothetical protein
MPPILVNGGDKDATKEDLTPFCLLHNQHGVSYTSWVTYHTMPMQLANRALFKMLLCRGNIMTCRQVVVHLLAHPSTGEDSRFRVAKAPFEVGYCA